MKLNPLLAAVLSGILVFGFFLFVRAAHATPAEAAAPFGKPDIVEVMELSGEISESTASAIKAQVEKINENPKIKAVVLVVSSPGGGALASAVIYNHLSRIKVPVVGYCEYMCASGGVYALMATSIKYIGVSDETIGGSVGVIMHMTRFNRLLAEKLYIDNETFKSGAFKDSGSSTRGITPEDRKYLQGIVDDLAHKFYGVVIKARPKVDLKEVATAKIFIGEQIVKVGLADAVMTRDQAIAKAKELSGSKLAFTREELGRMSKAASETTSYKPATAPADFQSSVLIEDLHLFADIVRDIRAGETVRFDYRAQYRF